MYLCDRTEIELHTPSRTLMYRASRACADALRAMPPNGAGPVLILCGSGNNGGDGILCARLLCEDGIRAILCPAFSAEDTLSEECAYRYAEAVAAGVPILPHAQFLTGMTDVPSLIVDALLGIGLSREPDGIYAALIDAANTYSAQYGIPTAAIDIASGIFTDTGKVSAHTFRADRTLAINNAKRGHLLYPGASFTGELTVLDIGIPETPLLERDEDFPVYMLTDGDVRAMLPPRLPDSNKGTNGRILIAAGAPGMCGAAYLSALAAYRCGAGLVEIFTCEENRIPLQALLPEAILTVYDAKEPLKLFKQLDDAVARAAAIVVGPGLGQTVRACSIVTGVLEKTVVPTVLDADALNLMADLDEQWEVLRARKEDQLTGQKPSLPPLILTPHPGELSRLTGTSVPVLLDDLIGHAQAFAEQYSVILNAKNTRSVITDGKRAYINPTGTSALAKGGSGDVLSGITATLAAQMCDAALGCDALTAAALAAYLHGRAAEAVTARMGTRSPLASEIADALGEVFLEIMGG